MSLDGRSEPTPLSVGQLILATIALGLGSFMNILDLTIANVSVPTIAGDLGVSYTQATWVITSYAVSEAILLPMTGWLALRYGQVRMFVTATLLFTATSLVCGLAFSFPMLVIARVAQGAFGAAMIPLSQTLMASIYPPNRRGMAMGLWAMTTILAPIVGPLAGGWITEHYSWHWVFLINLPFGLLVAGMSWTLLRKRETPRMKLPLDRVGLALLVVGVGALQVLLDRGNELDWFESPEIITLGLISFVALTFLVVWELGEKHPLVDLRMFRHRNYSIGVACITIGMVAYFGVVVVQPLWLQSEVGYTPLWAGKVIAFSGIFGVMLGPVLGANIHRTDARYVVTFGMLVFAISSFWSARFTPDVDFWTLGLARLFIGLGISCFFLPLFTISLSGITPANMAAASGLQSFMRNIGSSFGTAVMVSLWDHRTTLHHAQLSENFNPGNPVSEPYLRQWQSLMGDPSSALAQVDRVVTGQAHLMATNDLMMLSGAIMGALILVAWMARPPFGARGASGH